MEIITIGIIGAIFILSAFTLNSLRIISDKRVIYSMLNLIGSGILVYYSYFIKSLPFIILNSVWLIVSIIELIEFIIGKPILKK